jgi:hypothetical protein
MDKIKHSRRQYGVPDSHRVHHGFRRFLYWKHAHHVLILGKGF